MASIKKNDLKNGVSYTARIKKDGVQVVSKTFSTKRSAQLWAKRVENDSELMEALGLPGAGMDFHSACQEYLEQWRGRDLGLPKRIEYWERAFGSTKLTDITAEMIRKQLKQYAAGKVLRWDGAATPTTYKLREANRTRKPATVNRMKASLSTVLKYCVGQGYINENPCRRVPGLTEDNKRTRYLSEDERTRLFAALDNSAWPKMRLLVLLALTTGCRQGELLGLTWDVIDFKNRTAYLSRTKNGDARVVPLPNVAITELMKWREVGTGLVFPSVIKPKRPFEFRKHWHNPGCPGSRLHMPPTAGIATYRASTAYETA